MTVDEALHFAFADRGPAKGRILRAIVANEILGAEVRRLREQVIDAAKILSPVACGNSPQRAAADAWMLKHLGLP